MPIEQRDLNRNQPQQPEYDQDDERFDNGLWVMIRKIFVRKKKKGEEEDLTIDCKHLYIKNGKCKRCGKAIDLAPTHPVPKSPH